MTNNNQNLYSQLSEQFPQEMQRSINKGGTNLTYIPISEVINRLNKVFGVDKWSMTIESCHRDPVDSDFVIAHVRVAYFATEFTTIVRDGIGGSKIKRTKQGQILDLGDEFKGAISDALKKAAQAFGVGLYLARSDDAIEIEQVMEAEQVTTPEQASQTQLIWDNFMALSKKLTKGQKEELRSAWAQWSNGQATPNKDSVTEQQANFLLTEAMRLSFSGSTVIETPPK